MTIFSRGRHSYPIGRLPIETLMAIATTIVSALEGRHWDAVIDTCGYVPSGVERVMNALDRERIAHYTFVSSISVYADFPLGGFDEDAPVATITPEQLSDAEAHRDGSACDGANLRVRCTEP